MLKVAIEWGAIERMPCTVRLLKTGGGSIASGTSRSSSASSRPQEGVNPRALVAVPLVEKRDYDEREKFGRSNEPSIDFVKRQLRVERSGVAREVTTTKGNRVCVPLTIRLARVLQEHRHLKGPGSCVSRTASQSVRIPSRASG